MENVVLLSVFLLAAAVTGEAERVLDVEIRSEACDDPGKLGPGCGWAFIKVDGKDLSPHKRGHNIVILDAETGAVLEIKSFDTHADRSAGSQMRNFLYEQHGRHRIVLVAIQDDGSNNVRQALRELKKLGTGQTIFRWYRGSIAFVGYGGYYQRPSWIQQVQYAQGMGPSIIQVNIPLGKQQ